jgi:MoxR-like ATPase
MEEKQISVDGTTYILPKPYFVIATQNPVEIQGTFPLPEAQLDRFLLQLSLGYPSAAETVDILKRFAQNEPLDDVGPVCDKQLILSLQQSVKSVYIHDDIYAYIAEIAQKTRIHEGVQLGISTRGILALARLARAYCAICGQDFVTPKDILYLIPYAFPHRMVLRGGIRNRFAAAMSILDEILENTTAPVEEWKQK